MFKVLITSLVLIGSVAEANCTRYCNPEKSKPCGKSCISKDFTCHKTVTTACAGKRPVSSLKGGRQWGGTSEAEVALNKIIGL
jgi:hypothetical protein